MKQRIIYDNYNLWEQYSEEAYEYLLESNDCEDEVSEDKLWEEIYDYDSGIWEDEHERLIEFFGSCDALMLSGYFQLWNGKYYGGKIFFNFDDMFNFIMKDCVYIKLWDENGHFYIKCSHHDGTNVFEVKLINRKALDFIEHWEYNNDPRTEEEIHDIIWNSNFLSRLPHYAHTVYGCKKKEK